MSQTCCKIPRRTFEGKIEAREDRRNTEGQKTSSTVELSSQTSNRICTPRPNDCSNSPSSRDRSALSTPRSTSLPSLPPMLHSPASCRGSVLSFLGYKKQWFTTKLFERLSSQLLHTGVSRSICVLIIHYMCPHTTTHVLPSASLSAPCVLILLYLCHLAPLSRSICVLTLLCVLILWMCKWAPLSRSMFLKLLCLVIQDMSDTVFSYYYMCHLAPLSRFICVIILLYMCSHTTIYASSYN